MFWFFGLKAWGILVPQPGMEPTPPALEGEALTIGQPDRFFNECGNELNSYMSRRRCISQASMGDGWRVDTVMIRMLVSFPMWWYLEVGPLGGDSVEMRSWEWSPHDVLLFSHSGKDWGAPGAPGVEETLKPWAQQPLPILCSPSGASHWPQVAKTKSEVKIPWESRGQSLREQRGRRVDLERQV